MATTFFGDMDKYFNQATSSLITTVSQNIISNLSPFIVACLTLWVCVYGYLIISQKIEAPISDFLFQAFVKTLIVSIALSVGNYQEYIVSVFNDLPNEFAKLATSNTSNMISAIDGMMNTASQKASEISDNASILESGGITKIIVSWVIGIGSSLIGGIGGASLLITKVAVAILLAIGPLFIVCLLNSWFKNMFTKWLESILGYSLTGLMITIVFSLLTSIVDAYISNIDINNNSFQAAFAFIALTIISMYFLFVSKELAMSLTGILAMPLNSAIASHGNKAGNRYAKNPAIKSAENGVKKVANKSGSVVKSGYQKYKG
jgi:type IV secretion system protein VirB6